MHDGSVSTLSAWSAVIHYRFAAFGRFRKSRIAAESGNELPHSKLRERRSSGTFSPWPSFLSFDSRGFLVCRKDCLSTLIPSRLAAPSPSLRVSRLMHRLAFFCGWCRSPAGSVTSCLQRPCASRSISLAAVNLCKVGA